MPRLKKQEMKLQTALDNFMYFCTEKDLTLRTLKSYESTLRLFFKYLEEECNILTVNDVTSHHVKEYLEWTKERGKYSFVSDTRTTKINNPSARGDFGKTVGIYTINNYLRNIKVFFSYCYDEAYVQTNVTTRIKAYKCTRVPKSDITDSDFKNIIRSIDTTTFAGYRDYVILHLLMDTGMRVSECLALKVGDVDFSKKTIFISAFICKGRKDRYVFFSNVMSSILDRWLDYKDRYISTEYLFVTNRGNTMDLRSIEKNLRKYVGIAGIDKNITCHTFRNNFGKRFLSSNGSIYVLSQILGHSSVEVTQQAYSDLTTDDIRKSYIMHSPLESIKKKGGK